MPFFQGAYNFETHGGSFQDSTRHRRHRRLSNAQTNTSPARHESPHRSTSLPTASIPTLKHSATVESEKTIDEEAQTIIDTPGCFESLWMSLTNTLPCQLYMQLLLRLPSHYFNRVDRLSRDANLALKEILDLSVKSNSKCGNDFQYRILDLGQHSSDEITNPESLPPAYRNLTVRWGCFIDDLLEEWKTLNVVSALLVPGILTIFQVTGAANDPVTRYLAFWSLISALLSLLYGCAFIIQFSRMRKPSIAIEWAFEAQNSRSTVWSVWVMLSLPVVWLAWSIIAFMISIMTFMWRSGVNPPDRFPAAPSTEFGFRIFVSAVLAVGVFYGALILISFQRYGPKMDEALSRRIDTYIASAASASSISQSLLSAPKPRRSRTSFFPKRSNKKSSQPNSRSSSPIRHSTSNSSSPLTQRPYGGGFQQNSSSTPHQPSPLSGGIPVIEEEHIITPPASDTQELVTDKASGSISENLPNSEALQAPSLSLKSSVGRGVIGLDFSESMRSSQTMVPPYGTVNTTDQEPYSGNNTGVAITVARDMKE